MATEKSRKKNDVWKIKGILSRIDTLIRNGTFKSVGIDKFFLMVKEEFAEAFLGNEFKLDKDDFRHKVCDLVWSQKVISEMKNAIRNRFDPKKIYEVVSYIPEKMFYAKWNKLRGKSVKGKQGFSTVHGILRLSDELIQFSGNPIDFDTGTFSNPFTVKTKNGNRSILSLNGVNLGVPYSGVIEENPALQAFENANRHGDAAIFLTNFLNLPMKKASGPLIVYRALLSGLNINPNNLDPKYIEKAKRILNLKPHDEMVYQTTSEAFLDLMRGWAKIVGTKKNPTFNGPVYVVLGYEEEALIAAGAYWEAHHLNLRQQTLLQTKIRFVRMDLRKDVNNESLWEKLNDLSDELARTRITYISQDDLQQYYFKVMRFVIKTVEDTIPNSKVIGIGTSHAKIFDKILEINIPAHNRPSDGLLSNYCSDFGPKVLNNQMADAVVICHPYSPNFRMTAREADKDGQRKSVGIFLAPIAVDEIFIYRVIRNTVKRVTELSKTMNRQFRAGVLRLNLINGTFQPDVWSIPALHYFHSKCASSRGSVKSACSKFIYTFDGTDTHYGSGSREILVASDGKHFGVPDGFIELMRRSGLLVPSKIPIHMFVANDDWTQGHHFPAEQQPDRQKMSYQDIEKNVLKMNMEIALEKDDNKRMQLIKKYQQYVLNQFELRPDYWPQEQIIQVLERFIRPNLDFFDAVLSRDIKIGLKTMGVSEFQNVPSDTCDAGLVVMGTGNHFFRSVEGQLTEGFLYARELKLLLSALPNWRNKVELLNRLVTAPLYGNILVGWGTVQLDGGYMYSVNHRSSPTGTMDWNDPLRGVVNNDSQRGNISRMNNGRYIISTYGDKHFLGVIITPYGLYFMAPPAVHTDKFAEFKYGFPANNTGVGIIGVPSDGPDKGPILVRYLMYDVLKDIFENNKSIDWKAFLPNPA
jgi:hypothetical protein